MGRCSGIREGVFQLRKKLTAYLAWYEDWHNAVRWDEIGEGDHPAQNPPRLNEHDAAALEFFSVYCNGLSIESGMLVSALGDVEYEDAESKALLIMKLGMIYSMNMKLAREKAKDEANA